MVDVDGKNYRDSTLQDLHDAARITDRLDNIHFLQRPMVARDILDNREMDLNTIYACCSGTKKHIGTSFTEPSFVKDAIEMLHIMAGAINGANVRLCPFKLFCCSDEARNRKLRGMHQGGHARVVAKRNKQAQPPLPPSQVQSFRPAERLAGWFMCIQLNSLSRNLWQWLFARSAHRCHVRGQEQALLTAGCRCTNLWHSRWCCGGIADAKLPDMQAGWEQMNSNLMAGLTGLNMVYESVGMHASLLAVTKA